MANLVEFLTGQRDGARTLKTTATQDVATAKAETAGKRTAAAAAAAVLNKRLQEIAAIRRDLAGIPTSDDGTALVAKLQAAILAAHAAQADTLRKTADADAADSVAAQRGAELDSIATRLAGLESMLAEATGAEAARKLAKQGATQAVRDAATAALTAAPFTAAKTRIEDDFPPKLRARAFASADLDLNRAAIAKAASSRAKAALNEKLSAVEKAKRTLEAAEAELNDYVKGAPSRLKSALTVLKMVANPAEKPLTEPEKAAIGDKLAERDPAADKEIALSQKQIALDNAQDAVDAAGTPTQAQIDARNNARGERDTAAAVVDDAVKTILHEWEAAVPDANWQMFADYDGARRALEFLRDADPVVLVTAVNSAEDALVAAIQVADTALAAHAKSRGEAARSEALLAAIGKLRDVRMLSALRGDF